MRGQHLTVVQVCMRKSTAIKDVLGRRTTHDKLTSRGNQGSPTLIFSVKKQQS